jgi:hypothetical protein
MLRIEKDSDGCVTRLILSGRIQSDYIACLRSAMSDGCARKVLDLTEATLVDLGVVRFLIRCDFPVARHPPEHHANPAQSPHVHN